MKNPCQIGQNYSNIVANFTQSDQIIVNNLFKQILSIMENSMKQSVSSVVQNKTSLIAEFQAKDPNGFLLFKSLLSYNTSLMNNCTIMTTVFKKYFSSLNNDGQQSMSKIGCFVLGDLKKSIATTMGQFILKNVSSFMMLKNNEGAKFNQLLQLFQKSLTF